MKYPLALFLIAAGPLAAQTQSPAQSSIAEARQEVIAKPRDSSAYNLLAKALMRRAQETSDDSFYEQAAKAVQQSLALSPGDFEARKLHVMVLLGAHNYLEALAEAKALNKQVPDDVAVYGFLTDAYSQLGNYKDAETSAQWMLNLRPGNLPAFVNAAHLREAFGEMNGSYDALNLAYQSTSPTQNTERADLLTQMGRERRLAGNFEEAEKLLKQALVLFPAYNSALGELAAVYIHNKRFDDASALLRQRLDAISSARNSYDLAEALETAGHREQAEKVYTDFVRKALAESTQTNNADRELVFYYADRAHQPSKALEVAKRVYAWRQDIYTLDAYAWALHVNGQDGEARKQLDIALAVGTRDPKILAHSEQIKASANSSLSSR